MLYLNHLQLEPHKAPLPAVFGHNQAQLQVQWGSNPAQLPVISGHNLAPLLLIFAKEMTFIKKGSHRAHLLTSRRWRLAISD